MYRCFELALQGAGNVAPNPMVGAVLVHDDTIIGEGWHRQYGQAHAEVNCINSVADGNTEQVANSTLYVSLEPCAHYGKTPPCADLIIGKKIPRVVIGCKDSFEAVDGKGIAKLEAAGVQVITGVLEKEAQELNKRFFTFYTKQRPYILLKWAQTADKKIAGNKEERLYISNDITNRLVHRWRTEEAAILVGTNTAITDNPSLTSRLVPGNNPLRLVIDKKLQLPASHRIFDAGAKTIVYNFSKENVKDHIQWVKLEEAENLLPQVLEHLYKNKTQSLMVEGGAILLQSFIAAGLWDEARVITNNSMYAGAGIKAPVLENAALYKKEQSGTDSIEYFKNSLL
ncbi:MAG: bifunctional diaminohydroxyphosphoribosylaminopyrimidine deaminase/5-amino-6-(5-phosphoribosylamino)uracil reductase RibD [Ferruginibacter sp.]